MGTGKLSEKPNEMQGGGILHDLAFHPSFQGGVVILLVASCDRNLDKLSLDWLLISLSVDFTFLPTKCKITLKGSDPCFSGHSAFQAGAECTAWLSLVLKLAS